MGCYSAARQCNGKAHDGCMADCDIPACSSNAHARSVDNAARIFFRDNVQADKVAGA